MDNLISALIDARIVSQSLGEMLQANKEAIRTIDHQLDRLYSQTQRNENHIVALERRKEILTNGVF